MPGLLKIGFTRGSLDDRLKQLSTSGIPQPFELGAAFRVSDPSTCEKEIHSLLQRHRPNRGREFFKIALAEAVSTAMPVLNNRLSDDGTTMERVDVPSAELGDADDLALKMLAHDHPEGATVQQLVDGGHSDHPLELWHRLIALSEKGLVEEKRNRGASPVWRLTNSGLKFMFENDLILKDLIEDEQ